MDETASPEWKIEAIPNQDLVFRNVLNFLLNWVDVSKVPPNVFVSDEDGMSVDWNKYSTPEDTRNRARNPEKNGVFQMNVGKILAIEIEKKPVLNVIHAPIIKPVRNRAHSLIRGIRPPNKSKIRRKLQQIAKWVIQFPRIE